jgi:AAA domain/DnaB-like helicase N terminal domain
VASPLRSVTASADDRPPPSSPDNEKAVLGAILLNVTDTNEALKRLDLSDFFMPAHKTIFAAILKQFERGQSPDDILTLQDALATHGKLETIPGGTAYLGTLFDGIPRVCHLLQWVEILKAKTALRQRAHIGDRIKQLALSANGNASEVLEEIAILSLPLLKGVARTKSGANVVTGSELLAMSVQPREFLLEGLLTKRSMAEIFAWRGVGKTWAALSAAHAIATGGTFLKWTASKPRPVLFVDGELDTASLQLRIHSLDATAKCPADKLKLLCCDMQDDPFPHLASRAAQVLIEDVLGDSELLVLDNLSALAPSSNEQESEHWTNIQAWLLDLRRRGVASLFLHHAGHSGWARGTTRREDLLDLVIELRRPKDYVASEGLRVEVHFTKTRGMLANGAEPIEASLSTDLDGKLLWTWHALDDKRTQQVVALRQAGNSFREIEKLTDIPRSTAERLYKNTEASR